MKIAIGKGIKGTPIGNRLLLLNPGEPELLSRRKKIDYAQPLPRCLSATEKGMIELAEPNVDLFIASQLDQWAEHRGNGKWQLTAASVKTAVKGRTSTDDLIQFLQSRLVDYTTPRLLAVAIEAWGRWQPDVEIESVTVLRCPYQRVYEAIATSETFKPYFCGRLGDDLLLVEASQLDALKVELAWAGLKIKDQLLVQSESRTEKYPLR